MEWIDSHVHVGKDREGIEVTEKDVRSLVSEGTIDGAVVFCFHEVEGIPAGNENIRNVVEGEEDLAGLFRIDPDVHHPDVVRAADWASGFKMHPRSQEFELKDAGEYFEAIGETGKPLVIHTGVWREHTHPEAVLEAVDGFDDVDFILAHNLMGYYYGAPEEFLERLQAMENVHLDLSIHLTPLGAKILAEDLGAERLLFASDYPYGHPEPMKRSLELADLSGKEREMIAGGNARRLFFR